MLPIIMLAAQLLSKQQQQAEARRREVAKLAEERAARLGGNTMGVEAANFNRELGQHNFASPAELMQLYGSLGSDSAPAEGETSTTPGSDNIVNPWGKGAAGVGGRDADLLTPKDWQDDPYGVKRRF
jgi:hypothetical protein